MQAATSRSRGVKPSKRTERGALVTRSTTTGWPSCSTDAKSIVTELSCCKIPASERRSITGSARASRSRPASLSSADRFACSSAVSTAMTLHCLHAEMLPLNERELIERYFQAMRTGATGTDAIVELFAEAAVYVEPFSGEPKTHVGRDAIRQSFVDSQKHAPPDMTLTLEQVDIESGAIRSVWTCTSPAFAHPMRGQDLWTIRDGKILRLETSFL